MKKVEVGIKQTPAKTGVCFFQQKTKEQDGL